MTPAQLPEPFLEKPERLLRDLQPGESGWVLFTAMAIDSGHRCYIDPSAKLSHQTSATIRVRRTDAGIEVGIPPDNFTWEPGKYQSGRHSAYRNYVPVVRVEAIQP